ncbi:helix-turn-helix domain-containing protein [Embleya sp. NPDC055664]|uniref:helix-turn-helix domain-containing protein n=1 Tax=Embleya TaxID=2699295 RepID=UPI000D1C4910|nr:helix-turn-helix domain-containing protein [Embleya scabrispora]
MRHVAPGARETRTAERISTPTADEPIRMIVARNVRMLARRDGYTDGAIGEALGHGRSWAWRRFTGELPFDLNDVERLAELFQVDPAHLLAPAHTWAPDPSRRAVS